MAAFLFVYIVTRMCLICNGEMKKIKKVLKGKLSVDKATVFVYSESVLWTPDGG